MTTFENQITNYPKGARVEAIREIPLSSPSQNYYADPLPRGTRGVVTAHTDDGRAWINFDGHGQEGFGHTFEQPEKYIRVVCTHRDDNCPTNHDAPAAPERGEHSPLPWSIEDGPSGYADESADSHYTIIAADSFSIAVMVNDCVPPERGNAGLIVRAVNQHSTLIAQREQLLRAAQFALSTPGMIRGRDSLQRIVDEVLTTIEQEGTTRQ